MSSKKTISDFMKEFEKKNQQNKNKSPEQLKMEFMQQISAKLDGMISLKPSDKEKKMQAESSSSKTKKRKIKERKDWRK